MQPLSWHPHAVQLLSLPTPRYDAKHEVGECDYSPNWWTGDFIFRGLFIRIIRHVIESYTLLEQQFYVRSIIRFCRPTKCGDLHTMPNILQCNAN